jgi:hypothetical protein
MNKQHTILTLPVLFLIGACAGQDEMTSEAQQEYELLCQDLQLEYLYSETDEERKAAENRIAALECNKSVSAAEKRRRDADHSRSMRSRAGDSPGSGIVSSRPED